MSKGPSTLQQALGCFGATVAHEYSWQQAFHLFGLLGIVYSLVLIVFLKDHRTKVSVTRKANFGDGWQSMKNSLGPDVSLLAIPVVIAIILQLTVLKPKFADKLED